MSLKTYFSDFILHFSEVWGLTIIVKIKASEAKIS